MHDEFEQVRSIFAAEATGPPVLSTVDIGRAIETGKRRRRFRRFGIGGAAVSLGVVAAIAVPYALQADHGRRNTTTVTATADPSGPVSPAPTAKPGFRTRAHDRPPARALPTSCQGTKLQVPGGGIKSHVSNMDASGRYVTGRIYPNSDTTPVLWRDGKATPVPFGGGDDVFEAANTKGDAVGLGYYDDGPRPKAYIGGKLRDLKGGNAEPTGINDSGRISGQLGESSTSRPVVWPSADADPVKLPFPDGFRSARANDIDEDGTIVGNVSGLRDRIAYVWYPDGTAQPLPTPVHNGRPAFDFDARRVRNGWVTGLVAFTDGPTVGVRWDLATGKVDLFDQIQWSNDVSPDGWIVGMDHDNDAVVTDGARILKLPNVFPKHPEFAMNWGEAISDDGLTVAGHNDDKNHDGEQRGVLWKCR